MIKYICILFITFKLSCHQNTANNNPKEELQNRTTTKMSEEEMIIRSKRELSNQAIQFHDTDGISIIWCEDFQTITSRNEEITGIAANRHSYAQEFSSKDSLKYIRTPLEIKTNPKWRMASESGTWVGQWSEPDGPVTVKGTYYAKWHYLGNQWKVRMEVYTAISCEGSRYCDQVPILEYDKPF
ncbi:MAG: nuclear transport factor 2 family protein [Saprospiraceae bacterium]